MRTITTEQRRRWRALSHHDKQQRLQSMRQRQQQQIALEMLHLRQAYR